MDNLKLLMRFRTPFHEQSSRNWNIWENVYEIKKKKFLKMFLSKNVAKILKADPRWAPKSIKIDLERYLI